MDLPKLPPIPRRGKETTRIGFRSEKGQTVVRKTDLAGTDHGQSVYVLRCDEGHEYGANGTDIHLRICPYCNPRATGEDLLKRTT